MLKYRVATRPKKDGAKPDWTNPKGVVDARDVNVRRQRSHIGGGYRMREQGDPWGPLKDLSEVHDSLPARLDQLHVGQVWAVKAESDDYITMTRKVDVEPPVVQTPGTDAVDRLYTWLQDHFRGKWENWGICVCKRIEGTSTWSQHAYCNAIDVGGATGNLEAIAKAATAAAKAGHIPCDQVIWQGWEHVHGGTVYDHYDHVHLTGQPQRSGYPTACG